MQQPGGNVRRSSNGRSTEESLSNRICKHRLNVQKLQTRKEASSEADGYVEYRFYRSVSSLLILVVDLHVSFSYVFQLPILINYCVILCESETVLILYRPIAICLVSATISALILSKISHFPWNCAVLIPEKNSSIHTYQHIKCIFFFFLQKYRESEQANHTDQVTMVMPKWVHYASLRITVFLMNIRLTPF